MYLKIKPLILHYYKKNTLKCVRKCTLSILKMSVLCRVSCVPASCVHIWFVSCPRLMWLLVNSCPAVFVSLSMIYLCIYSPVCSVWFGLFYSLLPGVSVHVSLALMSTLKTVYLSLILVCVFLVSPCCVHCDRRPDLNSKQRPFTSFCFSFLKVFCFVPACLFCPSQSPLVLPL